MISRCFSAPESMDPLRPICRKKSKNGIIFPLILRPKPLNFEGHFPTISPSQGDDFSVLFCSRKHGFREAYLQKKILDSGLIFPLSPWPKTPNFGGHFPTISQSQGDDFSVFLGARNHGFCEAYLQKKFQDCGLIFPLILRPKPPNFEGHFLTIFPSLRDF